MVGIKARLGFGIDRHKLGAGDADQLFANACWIGEGAKQVEDGALADLNADWCDRT